jgi:hypothetical protein
MFYSEHGPAHLHAVYGEFKMTVDLDSLAIRGEFPARADRLVIEWMQLHHQELVDNWNRARQRQPLERIAPLE